MSAQDFLVIWAGTFVAMFACRAIPIFALRGRALPPRVAEALNFIPPAAFAALVANDLFSPTMFASGIWPGLMPVVAAAIVFAIARKTGSLMWCCVGGVVAYLALSLI